MTCHNGIIGWVATQICEIFQPYLSRIPGGEMIQFDGGICFKWVGEKPPSSILTLTAPGLLLFGMTNVSASVVGSLDRQMWRTSQQKGVKCARILRKWQNCTGKSKFMKHYFHLFPIIHPDGKLVGRGSWWELTTCVLIAIFSVVKGARCDFWTDRTDPEVFGKSSSLPKNNKSSFHSPQPCYISFPMRVNFQPLHTGAIIEKIRGIGSRSVMIWDCSVIDLLRLNRQPLRRGSC